MSEREYTYIGPVLYFDRCVQNRWIGTTKAISDKQALTNLTYQYKMQNGYKPNTKISLPGKLTRSK